MDIYFDKYLKKIASRILSLNRHYLLNALSKSLILSSRLILELFRVRNHVVAVHKCQKSF